MCMRFPSAAQPVQHVHTAEWQRVLALGLAGRGVQGTFAPSASATAMPAFNPSSWKPYPAHAPARYTPPLPCGEKKIVLFHYPLSLALSMPGIM
jgi:hypothetical protein